MGPRKSTTTIAGALDFGYGLATTAIATVASPALRRLAPRQQVRLIWGIDRAVATVIRLPFGRALYGDFRKHGKMEYDEVFHPEPGPREDGAPREDLAVHYSGGKDSLYAALNLAPAFGRLHLLTMVNRNMVGVDRSETPTAWLRERLGEDRIVREHIDSDRLFQELHFEGRDEKRRRFGAIAETLSCVTCFSVRDVLTIPYCKANRIRWVANGTSPQSGYGFEQNLVGQRMSQAFLRRYGIHLRVPLWERPDATPLEDLYEQGVVPEGALRKVHQYDLRLMMQPRCPLGVWQGINMKRHEFLRGHDDLLDVAARYRSYLEERGERYLREECGIVPERPSP